MSQLMNYSPSLPSLSNLESYIRWANQIPILSESEEKELATRFYADREDREAAKKLIMAHLRYVIRVARGYNGYGLPQDDLIQEGNFGLMKAIKRFDPNMGVRLVTFAMHWIKAEIHEFILRNWRIVKIATTKDQRKLFFKLRQATNTILQKTPLISGGDMSRKIAKKLNVQIEEVRHMISRMGHSDLSLDSPSQTADDPEYVQKSSRYDLLSSHNDNPATVLEQNDWSLKRHNKLHTALKQLDKRSQDILEKRWLSQEQKKITLQELADLYKVSAERIRQLEKQALSKLKALVVSPELIDT